MGCSGVREDAGVGAAEDSGRIGTAVAGTVPRGVR